MLRLACVLATEQGISVCAPVHDALLVEAPAGQIEDVVRATQQAMSDASAAVLSGFRLRTNAESFTWPDRYSDNRGLRMWTTIRTILAELDAENRCCTGANATVSARGDPVQSYIWYVLMNGRREAEAVHAVSSSRVEVPPR